MGLWGEEARAIINELRTHARAGRRLASGSFLLGVRLHQHAMALESWRTTSEPP